MAVVGAMDQVVEPNTNSWRVLHHRIDGSLSWPTPRIRLLSGNRPDEK